MDTTDQNQLIKTLQERITDLAVKIEKMKLAEYVQLLDRPWRVLYINFVAGVGRGVGIAVGFTILGAIVLYFLKYLVMVNLQCIGGFIEEIVRMVQLKI